MSEEKKKPTPEEKAKAAAAAKAAAEAKRKRMEAEAAQSTQGNTSDETQPGNTSEAGTEDIAKAKADAAAKAKAAAAAKAAAEAKRKRMEAEGASEKSAEGDADAIAKAKAAAAAKAKAAAAAAAKAKATGATGGAVGTEAEEPKKPSLKQPVLDKIVKVITEKFGSDVLEDSYINELSEHIPTLIVKREKWHDVARFMHDHEELAFDYLSLSLGVDYETYMESLVYLYSYKHRNNVCVKVKVDRDNAKVSSVMDIWAGADWFERETYDLLGITYEGHANMKRILLPDTWVGHPLRKDYVQYDEEV
ncbi:hypothetical protein AM501_25410 [Aneurinibacillus migulanus]|uniref:NADH-quinone oxidoreductase subunit C n=1 Tax=Aneurinibacillus migulanus TaxID=47500 RepID=UPI0005BE2716|nr:NADH-quinone oxidoreductase subunit C [Aneurinibacillus migulanus]KIV53570.1 hypothetical protein TS64_19350 [Aneurinibacillus migulanus]KPD05622.1 hypothetical protein AM501_25410 [Aneurinibacillus migulanus]CEH30694.1 NADH-quinone oxidoreductase [Aneurinibacillus migulanus]